MKKKLLSDVKILNKHLNGRRITPKFVYLVLLNLNYFTLFPPSSGGIICINLIPLFRNAFKKTQIFFRKVSRNIIQLPIR